MLETKTGRVPIDAEEVCPGFFVHRTYGLQTGLHLWSVSCHGRSVLSVGFTRPEHAKAFARKAHAAYPELGGDKGKDPEFLDSIGSRFIAEARRWVREIDPNHYEMGAK